MNSSIYTSYLYKKTSLYKPVDNLQKRLNDPQLSVIYVYCKHVTSAGLMG